MRRSRKAPVLFVAGMLLLGASLLSSCSSDDGAADGLRGSWQLQQFALDDGSVVRPDDPAKYTVEFLATGMAQIRSDCNRCGGGYTAGDASLGIGPLACTKASCGEGSLDDRFRSALASARSWSVTDGRLRIGYEGGSMTFAAE